MMTPAVMQRLKNTNRERRKEKEAEANKCIMWEILVSTFSIFNHKHFISLFINHQNQAYVSET